MQVLYINLASAPARNAKFRRAFENCEFSDWHMRRIEAVPREDPRVSEVTGSIKPVEKACYLSHLLSLRQSLDVKGHVLIAEDDTVYATETEARLQVVIESIAPDQWDVIFTHVAILDAVEMPRILKARIALEMNNAVQLLSLKNLPLVYSGAMSYLVNERSKSRLLALMDKGDLHLAFDLVLRALVWTGTVNGFLTLPFLSTVSDEADYSLLDRSDTNLRDRLCNAFQQMMWAGPRDNQLIRSKFADIGPDRVDDDVATLARILELLMSMQKSDHLRIPPEQAQSVLEIK